MSNLRWCRSPLSVLFQVIKNRHRELAQMYFQGWFAIDIVSILPFDSLGCAMDSPEVRKLAVFRVIRPRRAAGLQ